MLLVILTTVALAGCGGSSGPTAENLKARAEVFGAAFVDGNSSGMYEFAHPESKSACPEEEFVVAMNASIMSAAISMA